MSNITINHWKLTAIGMALVAVTALATGLVVARKVGTAPAKDSPAASPAQTVATPAAVQLAQPAASPTPATATPAATPAPPASGATTPTPQHVATRPTRTTIATCNDYATKHAGPTRDKQGKIIDVAKDAAVGAVGGAAIGALGGAIAGGGKGAGKGAAIAGIIGAGGGTLYGINENRKHDEQYRAAYASCMRTHGHAS